MGTPEPVSDLGWEDENILQPGFTAISQINFHLGVS